MASGNASRWTAGEAERELATWRASGKSLTAYARDRGLSVQRLHWWKRRLASGAVAPAPAFAAAIIRPMSAAVTLRVGPEIALEVADPALVPAEWIAAFAIALTGGVR